MPAQSEELRLLRWADTAAVPRNIFIYQGRIILVFSYNKATTISNRSYYIVRFPCPIICQSLFFYLAYIRPFTDFLARQLHTVEGSVSTNPHIFTRYDSRTGCFSTDTCLRSLQLSTKSCPIPLTIQVYRHMAIGIVKKHIKPLLQPFDPDALIEFESFLKTLAF